MWPSVTEPLARPELLDDADAVVGNIAHAKDGADHEEDRRKRQSDRQPATVAINDRIGKRHRLYIHRR